jgi:hypothetical protein
LPLFITKSLFVSIIFHYQKCFNDGEISVKSKYLPSSSSALPIQDSTLLLQQTILQACKHAREEMPNKDAVVNASINLEKGDYALQTIQIPKNSSVMLHSKDRVRLLYVGRRNRPMFILEQNSTLILREKLEIYYNCNNTREVMRLMIRSADSSQKGSSKVDISKEVKVSLFSQRTS